MRRTTIALLAGATALAACDGDGTGPDGPNLRGSYDAEYTLSITGAGFSETVLCEGALAILQQSDDDFSGTFTIEESEDCEAGTGTIEGDFDEDGDLRLELVSPGGQDPVEEITEVCEEVSGDERLEGTYSNGRILADAEIVVDCATELGDFRFQANIELDAQKR